MVLMPARIPSQGSSPCGCEIAEAAAGAYACRLHVYIAAIKHKPFVVFTQLSVASPAAISSGARKTPALRHQRLRHMGA
ncbi:hypothetical protein LNO89_19480 [Klebsiella pneumoniae subsp. pneumoniae]|nr:hypothetical protein [Klebsiella pneumoniae subsp. pneumoniae]